MTVVTLSVVAFVAVIAVALGIGAGLGCAATVLVGESKLYTASYIHACARLGSHPGKSCRPSCRYMRHGLTNISFKNVNSLRTVRIIEILLA